MEVQVCTSAVLYRVCQKAFQAFILNDFFHSGYGGFRILDMGCYFRCRVSWRCSQAKYELGDREQVCMIIASSGASED
jgi:hypothetical protein